MQVNYIVGKRELYFLKTFSARSQSEINKTEAFPAFARSAAETAAIALISAGMLGAAFIGTLKFMEFVIFLFDQRYFGPDY
jgi:hypothetical protein